VMRRTPPVILILWSLFLILTGCSGERAKRLEGKAPARPNIVLIVSDDHGTGDLGCYGNQAVKTPNLDYLASEGIRFTRAHCTTASCSASRSVILTGLYNHANAQYGHEHHFHHFSTYDHVYSLPVLLEELGDYHTGRIGKYHVAPEQVYHFQEVMQANQRNSAAMADSCLTFIRENRDHPFFLYFCTADPHRSGAISDAPLAPDAFGNVEGGREGVEECYFSTDDVVVPPYLPESRACREELAQYYQSVARVDYGLGKLFEHLKEAEVWENTMIIYISDNGIAFPGAKTTIYQPGINLPCLVKMAGGGHRGTVSDAMINWADLTPTILDVAGILPQAEQRLRDRYEPEKDNQFTTVNEAFHGRSFIPVLENPGIEGWDETYASHTFHEITMYYPMRSVIERKYKLIWNLAWQLPYPSSTDLWASSTYQVALKSESGMYAGRSIENYIHRPQFELYDLENDPWETRDLSGNPAFSGELERMKKKLRAFQERTDDPWILKWDYE
jgi:N-sulfoglucosamine sulfohydrolase